MGRNRTICPEDASESSGPLWCIPFAPDTGAIWGNLPTGYDLIHIEGSTGRLTPLERHRIFSARLSTVFHTIPVRGLQDGQRVCAFLRSENGAEIELILDFRLAYWQVEGTPQIVSFIASRLLPQIGEAQDHSTFERFLSLISSWRIAGRHVADIGNQSIRLLDLTPGCLSEEHAFLFWTGQKIRREVIGSFGLDGKTCIVASLVDFGSAYSDVDGELVQFELPRPSVTEQEAIAWVHKLAPQSRNHLLDRLSTAASAGKAACPSSVVPALRRAVCSLAEPGACLSIEGAFLAEDQLLVFIEVASSSPIEQLALSMFGSDADQAPKVEILTCQASMVRASVHNELTRTRIVARADFSLHAPPPACKILVTIGGRQVEQWVGVQAGQSGSGLRLARDFWRFAENDHRYIGNVASPLARSWARQPTDPPQALRLYRGVKTKPSIGLEIVCDGDLGNLHNTLLGIKSSLPPDQAVRLTLMAPSSADEACELIGEWVRRYALQAQIDLLSATTPAASAARPKLSETEEAWIALRAGFIPPRASWFEEVAAHLRQSPRTALVGIPANHTGSLCPPGEVSAEKLLGLLAEDAILAISASENLIRSLPIRTPVAHSVTGGWTEWLCEVVGHHEMVLHHTALDLLETYPPRTPSRFDLKVDESNLLQKITLRNTIRFPLPAAT